MNADLSGQVIDGRYKVEFQLGRGGMGAVWSVQHVQSLRHFALKTLSPELSGDSGAAERLLREARAVSALSSRHVAQVVDAQGGYLHDGKPLPYLVMERLDGYTLEHFLTTRGALGKAELVWLLQQVGRALSAAHARGIVHRDLKPSNVFLCSDEDGAPLAKLCDFGIAKFTTEAAAEYLTGAGTTTGNVIGTPLYMAPELLRATASASPASDQWALGLLAFRALTETEYFGSAKTGPELVLRIAHDPLAAPSALAPGLNKAFDGWFFRSCARAPEERFDNVAEQLSALEAALGNPTPVAPALSANALAAVAPNPAAVENAAERPRGRRMAAALALSWAALCAVGLLLWSPVRSSAASTPTAAQPTPSSEPAALETPATTAPANSALGTAQPEVTPIAPPPSAPPAVAAPRPSPTSAVRGKPAARSGAAPAVAAPRSAQPEGLKLRPAGGACQRSAECESHLCLAERCQ
ncbi:MAG TPA: protein kinase [Polyangiaceae bacterium]